MAVSSKGYLSSVIFSKFTLVAILILCLSMAISVFKRYTVEREIAERRYTAEEEFRNLEERRDTIFEKVEYLKGDSGVESEIRKNFDVARKGEKVVIIVDDESKEKTTFTEGMSPSVRLEYPWWQFWR